MVKRFTHNMNKTIPWRDRFIFTEKCANLIQKLQEYNFIILEGGAQAGKSAIAALLFAMIIMSSSPNDNLFLGLGYTSATAKNNIAEVSGFGLKAIFGKKCRDGKYYGKDCLYININGIIKTVVFADGATVSSCNGFHGFSLSGIMIDEIDRLHENTITEVKQRIQARPSAKVIMSMNPSNRTHPIYKWFDELIERGKAYLEKFSFLENPALTEKQKEEIISRYDPESPYYKRYILGERVDIEGLIYNIRDYNVIQKNNYNYSQYVVTADPGQTGSKSAFACVALTYNQDEQQLECHTIFEFSQHNETVNNPNYKTNTDIANEFAEFTLMCMCKMGFAPKWIAVDTSPDFLVECRKAFAAHDIGYFNIEYVIKNTDDMEVEERIKWSSSSLYRKLLRFDSECTETIKEFKETIYDPHALEKGHTIYYDVPNDDNIPHIDAIDCTLYGVKYFKDMLDEQFKYE